MLNFSWEGWSALCILRAGEPSQCSQSQWWYGRGHGLCSPIGPDEYRETLADITWGFHFHFSPWAREVLGAEQSVQIILIQINLNLTAVLEVPPCFLFSPKPLAQNGTEVSSHRCFDLCVAERPSLLRLQQNKGFCMKSSAWQEKELKISVPRGGKAAKEKINSQITF